MEKIINNKEVIGILGGVGPFASLKFVENIYKYQRNTITKEQDLFRIILYSDPSIPDRTTYLRLGKKADLYKRLLCGLNKLIELGADRIIICCYTFHYFFEALPSNIKNKIIPLTTIALEAVKNKQQKSLLLCSAGTSEFRVFENNSLWKQVAHLIVTPDFEDQERIHQEIYQMKVDYSYKFPLQLINELIKKYSVTTWIAGCTEMHLFTSQLLTDKINLDNIDPLFNIIYQQ